VGGRGNLEPLPTTIGAKARSATDGGGRHGGRDRTELGQVFANSKQPYSITSLIEGDRASHTLLNTHQGRTPLKRRPATEPPMSKAPAGCDVSEGRSIDGDNFANF